MDKILEVCDLKKTYGAIEAVRGISFFVERGGLFAFLGPNGAGKSTTIDILCTLLKADAGTVTIDGYQLGRQDGAIRAKIGVVMQDNLLDPLLTVRENLVTRGGLYGMSGAELSDAIERAATATAVTDFINRPYGKLSGGQRRRADVARALIHTPKLLFLDEPTTGLDPQTRSGIWETLLLLRRQQGLTVFLTTHYMEEAAGADYVVVIDEGIVAAKGTPETLRSRYSHDRLTLYASDPAMVAGQLERLHAPFTRTGGTFVILLSDTKAALYLLDLCRLYISGFEVQSGTMDDAFLGITGKEMRA